MERSRPATTRSRPFTAYMMLGVFDPGLRAWMGRSAWESSRPRLSNLKRPGCGASRAGKCEHSGPCGLLPSFTPVMTVKAKRIDPANGRLFPSED